MMPKPPDENDRKQAGTFTGDPMEGVTLIEPAPISPPPAPKLRQLSELADEALAAMLRRHRGEERPVATPWPSVNEVLRGGLWPGFYTLTSASGVGKTQWALQIALAAAAGELEIAEAIEKVTGKPQKPRPVAYVALELGPVDMVARTLGLLEARANVRTMWSDLAFGRNPEISAVFERNRVALRTLPLFFEVAPPRGWDAVRLETIAREHPRLVVIDYLQLVGRERHEDAREAMGRVAYQARAMARDHDCVVLALCSTARMNYGATGGAGPDSGRRREDSDPGPGKGDPSRFIGLGKESGDIEFAADGVFALINEPRVDGERSRTTHLAIAKQRGASPGWAELRFDGCSFLEPPSSLPVVIPGVGRSW